MKQTWLTVLLVVLVIACLAPACPVGAQDPEWEFVAFASPEPLTIDPALATDTSSTFIVDQLFSGLTRLDDTTGEALPDLAESWTASAGSTVFTFRLRKDARWSNGAPLTSADVQYGILRSLAPATHSGYAYILTDIVNASAYNKGTITDPNQVGVERIDDYTLRITLTHPMGLFPSIVALWPARPMPSATIAQFGDNWTQPGHIVTSGPYTLSEWAHNDHMVLLKNPSFYAASGVQIERANISLVDQATAWQLYLQGRIDTATIPAPTTDPLLGSQITKAPAASVYYYGFNTSMAPFDKPLVRKALAAAIDKQGLVDKVLHGVMRPAQTFTPPGVFGSVDGAAEGVGIPYNLTQARQWLAGAGYPNGQGLPTINLWYNTDPGHQAIAEYVRDQWTALGATVTLHNMVWQDYLPAVLQGQFPVWRLGWNGDYPEAYNFLHDGLNEGNAFGGWNNAAYEAQLAKAVGTVEPAARLPLYKQAEQILVQDDAVVIPLFYYTSIVATRPYLHRTFALSGAGHLAEWRIDRSAAVTVQPAASTSFAAGVDSVAYTFPAGSFAAPTVVTHTVALPPDLPPTGKLRPIAHAFELSAARAAQPAAGHPYSVTVTYSDLERGLVDGSTLALYWWDATGNQWVKEPTSAVAPAARTITAHPAHFSLWAVLGEPRRIYLPGIMRMGS